MSDDFNDGDQAVYNLLANIRTGSYLDALNLPPLSWQVYGLIPEGYGLLTGPPKVGKSWLVLDIALAVAAGASVLGHIDTGAPRTVLYLALEDGERRLQSRSRTLLGDTPIPDGFHYLTTADRALVLPIIREWLAVHGHLNPLVILDTLGKVMPPAKAGESAYDRDYRIGGELKAIVAEHPGSTLLVVHHIRKLEAEDWMDSTSGTQGLNGSADFTLNVHRKRNEAAGLLRITGRDIKFEAEYAATFEGARWTLDGDDLREAADKAQQVRATSGLGEKSMEVIRLVSEHPDGIGPTAVGNALGMSPSNATTYLTRAEKAGRITKSARGTYTPVTSVTSVTFEDESPEGESPDSPPLLQVRQPNPNVTHLTHVTPPLEGSEVATDTHPAADRCLHCGDPLDRPALTQKCRDRHEVTP